MKKLLLIIFTVAALLGTQVIAASAAVLGSPSDRDGHFREPADVLELYRP